MLTASIFGDNPGTGATNWAGYFAGNVNCTGTGYYVNGVFVASDESLKTNIEPLGSALEVIDQLRPKTYDFLANTHGHLSMPEGQQAGFIAPEVEELLPALVSNTSIAAELDSLGEVISPAIEYKALNYAGFAPYLVGAIQELSQRNDAMAEELASMREQLASCCARGDADGTRGSVTTADALANAPDADRKLRIVPNPFSEPPTVFYTLDRSGRMQLIANSADGKELNVLQEATLQAGDYRYAWDTTALAPGMYYVTLFLEGKPIVKKAVKVNR